MTHYTISYKDSPAPNFDAIEDIKDYLGAGKFSELSQVLMPVKDCSQFRFYCSFAGVQGFPVKAWYEHLHGQGSWVEEETL